jgi:hypothetical protein
MIETTKVLERKLRHETTGGAGTDGSGGAPAAGSTGQSAGPDNLAWRIRRPAACPWPFKAEDTSPLAWWRRLPPDAFRDAERLLLGTTLERISVLPSGEDFTAALRGDAAAAMDVAFSLMPVEQMTLQADIAMTALLRCALQPNAAAALVLAQVLGLTDLGHPFATGLAAAWFSHGQRHSADPRKFSQAETVLLAAFREREREGDGA